MRRSAMLTPAAPSQALNAAKFRRQMQERGLEGVVVPRTYWELSSNQVLVTEWCGPTPRADAANDAPAARIPAA